jgi:hypothetical protein
MLKRIASRAEAGEAAVLVEPRLNDVLYDGSTRTDPIYV